MAKILVIEDDQDLAETLQQFLQLQGHRPDVVHDGLEGYEYLLLSAHDLAIIDWQLPGMIGTDICFKYRSSGGKIPILMLTQKSSTTDKAEGLDSGADDYLPKPFDVTEFGARVRALLRRSAGLYEATKKIGKITLDPAACTVTVDGHSAKLLPSEFALVEFMLRHPGSYFTAEQLLNHVWDTSAEVSLKALTTCISRLRSKVDQAGKPSLIETSKGWGYKISEQFLRET